MSKEQQMIRLLVGKTEAGAASWTPTAEENEFITSVAGNTVSVKTVAGDPQGPDVVFAVLDEDGREVLSSVNGEGMEDVDYQILKLLHEMARRSAFKVDKTLDKIIQELESDIPF